MDDFRTIADALAADIKKGVLKPGTQLPPQRRFARQQHIAPSTAARVYGELVRRGLATGEVGRGTFIKASEPAVEPALAEPSTARIDLELNFPVIPEQPALLAQSLEQLCRPGELAPALRPIGVAGTAAARAAASSLLARTGWSPNPEEIFFTHAGRQAIAASIAALVRPSGRLGVETFTYPVVKGIAARLGVSLVPLDMDEEGLTPNALASASVTAIYVQPTLHNPLGITMSQDRRTKIVEILRAKDIYAIEDTIYGFLQDDLPALRAMAPERTVLVDSLSKRLSPGLTLGFVVPPASLRADVAAAIRAGGWGASHFPLVAGTRWINDGTATKIQDMKRRDARQRQKIARSILGDFTIRTNPNAYHCWWELPEGWRAETFVASAARLGIAVSPGAAFTLGSAHAPSAVRLALSNPDIEALTTALETLATLARSSPDDAMVE